MNYGANATELNTLGKCFRGCSPVSNSLAKRACVSIRWGCTDRCQWHVDLTDHPCGIKRQAHCTVELIDETLPDQPRPETLARRRPNGWTTVLLPSQTKLILQLVGLKADLNSLGMY